MKFAVALALLLPCAAHASVFEMFGAGPRAVGMGGAMTAAASGGEASFHNPAMLGGAALAGAWGGFDFTHNALTITLSRPVCTGDTSMCRTNFPTGFSTRNPQLPRDSSGFQLGWHYPLAGIFHRRVVLGAGLSLPSGHLIRISGPDPQTPNFPLYEGMPDRIAFLFAAAVRVTDSFWLGAGIQVLAGLDANIQLALNPTNGNMDSASIRIGLQPKARLTAGAALHPHPDLWLGLSYRQKLSLTYQIPTDVALGQPADLAIALRHETLFTPDSFHLGAAWRLLDGPLLLSADLALSLWSAAPDQSPIVALDVGGTAVNGMGLGQALDVGTQTPPIDLHYQNTLTPSVGVEWNVNDSFKLRTGYQYRPTPAPRATGPFNYLDNDAHAVGLGIGYGFGTLTAEQEKLQANHRDDPQGPRPRLHVDAGSQVLILPRRAVYKDDANDPVGNLEHGGLVWNWSLAFGGAF